MKHAASSRHLAVGLRCEHMVDPMGIDETSPRLSWRMEDSREGARQSAYQIVAASTAQGLASAPDLWDSGVVRQDRSLDIPWGGKRLGACQQVYWRVRIWDHEKAVSEWSDTACFELGLLDRQPMAKWIGIVTAGQESRPCPFLRSEFDTQKRIVSARAYVTARGVFELYLNGNRVSSDLFTPGWTDYNKRIQVMTYDVTELLREGTNAVGAILGDGWFAGRLGWKGQGTLYGSQLSLLLQIEMAHDDGSKTTFTTGPNWKGAFGPILGSDIYNGETYDARREMPGWCDGGFDDSAWMPVKVFPRPKAMLVGPRTLPVRRQGERSVEKLTQPKPGVHVFDMGQNMVGWVRLHLKGQPAGQAITLRFAEMLNSDGTLYTQNLRSAKCTDRYICKGGEEEFYEPRFTFHGFRYAEMTGLVGEPEAADITGVIIHSEIAPTGSFECSDPLVNRLQQAIVWGQRGNFLEVPTDCPQRDERLGWTGDAQIFTRTACFNRDVAAFLTKWCIDLEDAQRPDGAFTHVAPDVLGAFGAAAAYADAGIICPWTIYLCYGDERILQRQYESMARWVAWRKDRHPKLIDTTHCFGDWLAIDIGEGIPNRAPTPKDLIATAYFAYTTSIMAKVAAILGKSSDEKRYTKLAAQIRVAFDREFVSRNGRLAGDTQTGYLLALGFDMLPKEKRPYALARLVKDIEGRGFHLSTGFVGTPLLVPVLSRFGRTDVAYKLLLQQTYPAWLYPILQGATTMWERWNSFTLDKGFGDAGMNSFNHYAYGAVGEWMYSTVGGIDLDPAAPGYKHIIFRPQPGEGLTSASAELMTRYGRTACRWQIRGKRLAVHCTVPPNARATVYLPGRRPERIGAGEFQWTVAYPPASARKQKAGR